MPTEPVIEAKAKDALGHGSDKKEDRGLVRHEYPIRQPSPPPKKTESVTNEHLDSKLGDFMKKAQFGSNEALHAMADFCQENSIKGGVTLAKYLAAKDYDSAMDYAIRIRHMVRTKGAEAFIKAVDEPILLAADDTLLVVSSGKVYTKAMAPAGDGGPITSILTYPTKDYAGDRVRPDGGDWSKYPSHPYVNWAHRCPIGRGSVSHSPLKYGAETYPVAVGKTEFFQKAADLEGIDLRRRNPKTHRSWDKEAPYTVDEVLRVAAQAERLVREDIATGVSIEFDVDPSKEGTDWWNLADASLLEGRQARHFENWRGLGYAHARQPVNPGCQTLLSGRSAAAIEKAIVIAQTGKIGSEVLSPIILKAFDDLRTPRSTSVSVTVDTAPPTQTTTPVQVKGDTEGSWNPSTNDNSDGTGAKMSAGHQALMNAVQGLSDICEQLSNNGSDDLSIRRFCKKMCMKLKDFAGDIKARAEKHKAKLDMADPDKDGDDDTDDPMDEEDYTPSTEEKAITLDDKGCIITKAFPEWKPRRMTFADLAPAPVVETPAPTPAPAVRPNKAEVKANRRLAKSFDNLSVLLDAAISNGRV